MNNMKRNLYVILIFIISLCVHNGVLLQESTDKIKTACLDVSEVDESKLNEAREGTYAEDDQVAAYFHCFFMSLDFINFAAQDVKKQTILNKLPVSDKAKLQDGTDSCITKLKEREDRRAHELYTCFVKEFGVLSNFA